MESGSLLSTSTLYFAALAGTGRQGFAVVHLWSAPRREFQHCHELGDLVVMLAVPIAIPLPRLIVIAEKILRLSMCRVAFNLLEQLAKTRRREFVDIRDLKIHRQLHFVVVAIHARESFDVRFV